MYVIIVDMDKYIIIGLIILMILLLIIHTSTGSNKIKEKFEDEQLPNIESCPADLNRYTTDRGINCCEGTIENGQCKGIPRCTLSNNVPGLVRCIDYIQTIDDKLTRKYCPNNTQYFNDYSQDKSIIGFCTASNLSADRRRRLPPLDEMCTIYKDQMMNEARKNSCWVRKKIKNMVKPTDLSVVHADEVGGLFPVIFRVEYIDELQSKNCLDRKNLESILDLLWPEWRSNVEFKTNIYPKWDFCDIVREKMDARARDPNYVNPAQKFTSQIKTIK